MDNIVTLTGNTTREAELRFTPSGAPVASFGLAVNRRWQDRDSKEWQEATSFFDVTCWRALAENVSETVKRGDRVTVVGRLEHRQWQTDEGEKRSKTQVVADEVAISLRYATAKVFKVERQRQDTGTSSARSTRNAAPSAPSETNWDEEPPF